MSISGIRPMQAHLGLQVCGNFVSCDAKSSLLRKFDNYNHEIQESRFMATTSSGWTRCSSFHHAQLRNREAGRNHLLAYRGIGGCRDRKRLSIGAPRCAIDQDSAPTTRSASDEVQQKSVNGDKIADRVEQGMAVKTGLSALDAYFSKLNGKNDTEGSKAQQSLSNSSAMSAQSTVLDTKTTSSTTVSTGNEGKEVQGLKSLDAYFDKLNPKKPDPVQEEVKPDEKEVPENLLELTEEEFFLKTLMEATEEYEKFRASGKDRDTSRPVELKVEAKSRVDEDGNELDYSDWDLEQGGNATSDLINVLVALNVAVHLFGLASPHEAFGITDSPLPFVYGAKVNELIMSGQWWRLITPMFLHASVLHLGLGSWALLSFGPAVESAYGSLGFAMIYFLGGIFGNLTSFLHTVEWTVGGTGPIYALVGTWVVYLLKNRDTIGKEIADDMLRKVIILSALNVALWNSLPIDDWTHLGGILIGAFFGILASPTMQLNLQVKELDPDSKEEMGEAFLWFNDGLSPARLTLVFVLCLGIFFSLYHFSVTGSSDFYLLPDTDVFS